MKHLYIDSNNDRIFYTISNMSGNFKRLQEKAGIEPKIRLHDLRHSHASLLINLGFSPDVVADRLGHKNAMMVMTIYGHMYKSKRDEVVDALERVAAES